MAYAKISITLVVKESDADQVFEELIDAGNLIRMDHHIYWDDAANLSIEQLPAGSELDTDDDPDSVQIEDGPEEST